MKSIIKTILDSDWGTLKDYVESRAAELIKTRVDDKKGEFLASLNGISRMNETVENNSSEPNDISEGKTLSLKDIEKISYDTGYKAFYFYDCIVLLEMDSEDFTISEIYAQLYDSEKEQFIKDKYVQIKNPNQYKDKIYNILMSNDNVENQQDIELLYGEYEIA